MGDEENCPICGAALKHKIGVDPEYGAFDGVVCPNGCNLRDYYGR